MIKKIAVSIGHNPSAQGVVHMERSEYSECAVIAGYCMQKLTSMGYIAMPVPTGTLKQKVDYINDNNFDMAVEFHLNDFGRYAHGTEVIHANKYDSLHYAKTLSREISELIRTRNRGAKYKPGKYFVRHAKCTSLIVEPFFMRHQTYLMNDESYRLIGHALAEIL